MAKVVEVTVKANTEDAVKEVDNLTDSVNDLGASVEKTSTENKKAIKQVGDEAKKQNKVVRGLGSSVKAVGTALKAIGIGLVIALVAKLTEVFSRNQKVIDTFNTVATTLSIVFNQIFDAVSDAYTAVNEAADGFDALGRVMKGLITIALTPLKLAFFGIVLGVQQAQLAWEESFFGDKDPETIKNLNLAILETKNNLVDVALDAVEAGKEIGNSFVEAVTEIGEFSTAIIENVKEVSVSAAYEQAEAITQAQKNFELLALQQTRFREQADRDAEAQRRYRDDYTNSIEDRIKANDKLKEVLDRQEEAEKATVQARIDNLKQEQELLGFKQERVNEIYALETELFAIEAQQAGFRAEQEKNAIDLQKEKIQLSETLSQSEKERRLAQLDFEASQAETEAQKIELQRQRLEEENALILEDIERKRELYKIGTQARVDAENEYLSKSQDIRNKTTALDKQESDEKVKTAEAEADAKIGLQNTVFELGLGLAKEGSAIQKGVSAAQALINTYQGITKALAETTDVTPTQSLRFANAIAVGVAGFNSVRSILSTDSTGASVSPKSTVSEGGGASAPSFNLVQGTGTNQIAESIAQQQQQPLKAYVVSSNVTTSQSLDRNIIDEATI